MGEALRDRLGICQWFHYEDYDCVERTVRHMAELGCRLLRTGISWADYHRPHGRQWYDWQMRTLADAGLDLLVSVWHTPPSIAEGACCAGPPRRLLDFADFVWQVCQEYGDAFETLELWNEPNNRLKWAFDRFDPDWSKFARMTAAAAWTARDAGKATVLGGMIPVDPHWLRLVDGHGGLADVDVVGIHAFPEMWWPDRPNWDWRRDWHGWAAKLAHIAGPADGRPLWVTETGLATWDFGAAAEGRLDLQVERLRAAAAAPVERLYWYQMIDLHPDREAIEGFHVDENEYHLGLVRQDGSVKPAWHVLKALLKNTDSVARPVG